MSISSFHGLNTALRGLLAEQRAIDVTSHNIANADRAGYSRQEAVMTAAPALDVAGGAVATGAGAMLGSGVDVAQFRRIRDTFVDLQWRAQNMDLGRQDETARALSQIESVLQEPSDRGLGQMLNRFWSSWQDLANHPESTAARAAVVGRAQQVVDALRSLDAALTTVAANASSEYAQLTGAGGTVDRIARELARLDGEISSAVEAGRQPNDLLDRRDELLDQLSHYGQVSVTERGSGSIAVQFGDAASPLTDGSTVTWPQTLTSPGGRLGALLTLSTTTIPAYRADLDAVAAQLAGSVNGLHPTPVFSGSTAGGIAVVATTATIDAGSSAASGDNDVALAIAALRGGTTDLRYADLVQRIGQDSAGAQSAQRSAQAVVDSLSARRQSVSGVSIDEEMANLVRFQRAYQAAARAMSTADEMLDVLINRTGRVGL